METGIQQQTGARVIVLDDDEDICCLLTEILRDAGYVAECRMTTAAAVADLRAQPADLVIADIMIDGDEGPSFLDLRKTDPTVAAVPIIIHSGHPHAPVWAQDLGAPVLLKPVDISVLLEAVRRAVGTRRVADAPVV